MVFVVNAFRLPRKAEMVENEEINIDSLQKAKANVSIGCFSLIRGQ